MRCLALALVAAGFFATACESKVQQQRPPEIPEEDPMEESDMAPEESDTIPTAEPVDEEAAAADNRAKCCQQCVDGVQADTSGDPPGALNCASFSNIDPGCVVFFDKTPMTGKEAQECLDEGAGTPEPPPEG